MATKVKVIGPFEVAGIKPGDTGEVDEEQVLIGPLVEAELVEVIPSGGTKADLQAQAEALGLSTEGTKTEIAERIREAQGGTD